MSGSKSATPVSMYCGEPPTESTCCVANTSIESIVCVLQVMHGGQVMVS
jgi:hypothetical protein